MQKEINQARILTDQAVKLENDGKIGKALDLYKLAIENDPDFALPYFYIGNILLEQGNLADAIFTYKISLEKDPKNAGVYNNIGTAYAMEQKYFAAITYYKKALAKNKKFLNALENLASALASSHQIDKAIKYYRQALKISPDNGKIAAYLYHLERQNANWEGLDKLKLGLDKITKNEIKKDVKTGEDPFVNVIYNEDLELNYEVAKLWSKSLETTTKHFKFKKSKKNKINIGYISSHFHNHPTGHLIASLFKNHDRKNFNTFVYSLGPNDFSFYYENIKKTSAHFRDLFNSNLLESANTIFEDKLDILIELDGFTDNNRLAILALEPAPIQISYLGFPGTTGASFIDYIITDKIVTPPSFKKYFSEKFLYLSDCYQVNDDSQEIGAYNYSRRNFGIPESSFVFCSFNGTYKIEPKVFDVWMKILKKIPNSILWLLKTSKVAEENLKKEAEKRGINRNRLVFAKRLSREKHLKRLGLADLALDTFICNGHTTTSDALWAGVPVVTKIGNHFASRVAASILTAAGLPVLITKTPKEYEDLVIKIAKDPKLLKSLKQKLEKNKKIKPYFNTKKFTRNLEKAYIKMWQEYAK